jgi:hypothetical protein
LPAQVQGIFADPPRRAENHDSFAWSMPFHRQKSQAKKQALRQWLGDKKKPSYQINFGLRLMPPF